MTGDGRARARRPAGSTPACSTPRPPAACTNRLNVPELSSTPTGWIRLNIQARPKNRSSRMKRRRQARMLHGRRAARRGSWRQLTRMTSWMTSTAAVQVPAVTAPVQKLDRKPIEPTSSRMTSEPDRRFCANWRSSSSVEGGPRAGGGRQAIARLAHALRRLTATLRGGACRQREVPRAVRLVVTVITRLYTDTGRRRLA